MRHFDKKRILVVEDEEHIAEGLELNLSLQGYDVLIAPDGVVEIFCAKQPALLNDVMERFPVCV